MVVKKNEGRKSCRARRARFRSRWKARYGSHSARQDSGARYRWGITLQELAVTDEGQVEAGRGAEVG